MGASTAVDIAAVTWLSVMSWSRSHFTVGTGKPTFLTLVNVSVGPLEDRMMTTGKHAVADIFCNSCQQVVGWKYEVAYEKSQKYKEGKFILERYALLP
uniref:Protein yippee-like n=1 Tax=Physcomitrium patens TaxID=3218 RepID=A0A7I4AJD1_PHYPA